MSKLEFFIQGSAPRPYRVIAEGEGQELRMYCTCPRGSRTGKFCKHVEMLLVGDISQLVSPTEDVAALQKRSIDSPLVAQAHSRPAGRSNNSSMPDLSTLDALATYVEGVVGRTDVVICLHGQEGAPERQLGVFGVFKNGKPKKSPHIALNYRLNVVEYDGANIIERPAVRHWTVYSKSRPLRTFSLFSSAKTAFLHELEKYDQAIINQTILQSQTETKNGRS